LAASACASAGSVFNRTGRTKSVFSLQHPHCQKGQQGDLERLRRTGAFGIEENVRILYGQENNNKIEELIKKFNLQILGN
jgi:hypothetical protein